ncbi:MAG: single-stranded-DNA-specific exonuclease RecJ [Bacillota bacterium]
MLPGCDEGSALSHSLGIHPVTAQILASRGIANPEAARRFLDPHTRYLGDPFDMKGMPVAVKRLEKAFESGEHVAIYGDYDVDGLSATALLVQVFSSLGVGVSWYIPHRLDEGYGVHREAVEAVAGRGASLMVTVDTGIGAAEEVRLARSLGLDVIVTDHHQVVGPLPEACVINPLQEGCAYPFKGLCGAGIAFQLARALATRGLLGAGGDDMVMSLVDLAALGTLADQVPLLEDNRIIACEGIRAMGQSLRVGLQALAKVAGSKGVDEYSVGFGLAPRLNAAGRMGSPEPALDLLLTSDDERAKDLAAQLELLNVERQATESIILEEAGHILSLDPSLLDGVVVLASWGWHRGVLGIVAARLAQVHNRACILVSLEDGIGRGSGRSVPGVDLLDLAGRASETLLRLGGHSQAIGVELREDKVDQFRRVLGQLAPPARPREVLADARVSLGEMTSHLAAEMGALAPFGHGNPRPLLAVGAWAWSVRPVGKDGGHLQMRLTDEEGSVSLDAVAFGMAGARDTLDAPCDFLVRLEEDTWRGRKRPRAIVEDLRAWEGWAHDWLRSGEYHRFFGHRVLVALPDEVPLMAPVPRPPRFPPGGPVPQDASWRVQDIRPIMERLAREAPGRTLVVLAGARQVVWWAHHLAIAHSERAVQACHGLEPVTPPDNYEVLVVSFELYRQWRRACPRTWTNPALVAFPGCLEVETLSEGRWAWEEVGPDVTVVDAKRNTNRAAYVESLAMQGPCFVYTNTPSRSGQVAKALRQVLKPKGLEAMYYHPGLGAKARGRLAAEFSEGHIAVLVGTGAEGLPSKGIEVVFWDMPLGPAEFRFTSALALPDARVHLLYSAEDAARADAMVRAAMPGRALLVSLYTVIRDRGPVAYRWPEDIARMLPGKPARALVYGLEVLIELGLVLKEGTGPWALRAVEPEERRDLCDSVRFREASLILSEFEEWQRRALGDPVHGLSGL